jgi:hypothetical protein
LIFVMFAAVLLVWLTVICTTLSAAGKLIKARRGSAATAGEEPTPDGQPGVRRPRSALLVRGAAALVLVMVVLFGAVTQVTGFAGPGTNSSRVSTALAIIEQRSLPKRLVIRLSISADLKADRFQVLQGLCWALTAKGYHPGIYDPETPRSGHRVALTDVTIVLRGRRMTLTTGRISPRNDGEYYSCDR